MASKFTPAIRGALIERISAGCSLADAAAAAGIAEKTLKRWLARGRRERKGVYAEFVAELERAREEVRNRPQAMTPEEHLLVVSKAARNGSVQAMKLYWEMIRGRDEDDEASTDPLDELDELAERRAGRAA